MIAAAHQVVRKQAAREIRIEDGNGNGIDSGGQRFVDAFCGVALVPIAGNLRNLEDRQLDPWMLARVSHQSVRGLLRRSHAGIGEDATLKDMRKIVIENFAREVSTIVEQEIESGHVGARVQLPDESIVLFGSSLEAKGEDAPLVSRAHQLR